MTLTKKQFDFVKLAYKTTGRQLISRQEIIQLRPTTGRQVWFTHDPKYKAGRGLWKLPIEALQTAPVPDPEKPERKAREPKQPKAPPFMAPSIPMEQDIDPVQQNPIDAIGIKNAGDITRGAHVPFKISTFVPFGPYNDIKRIIHSQMFFPVFISGPKGLGKTIQVEHACAELGRDYFRVPITIETDEDDLLGGFRLINGETVWFYGPVPIAMMTGGILNLDEVDKASNKIMCLQPVLEGRGIYLKKINKFISPAPGFNVFSTANTKGRGSEDGKYITSQVLDDAFLGRFAFMIEQDFPTTVVETKILKNNLSELGLDPAVFTDSDNFVEMLTSWSDVIKKTHAAGGVDEYVDIRSLVFCLKSYAIFGGDRMKAIRGYCTKFDDATKLAFLQAYEAIDIRANTIPTQAASRDPKEVAVQQFTPF